MSSTNLKITRTKKIVYLFITLTLGVSIFIISIYNTMRDDRKLPSLVSSKSELAMRGEIISEDNFRIASAQKLFKASIDVRFLDEKKEQLFTRLFSIYSDIPEAELIKKIKEEKNSKRPGNLVLSYGISSRSAKNLKILGRNLRNLGVFKERKINGQRVVYGLTVRESGEKRLYSYKDSLSPVIGYVRKFETDKGKTKVRGIKGLEKKYNRVLNDARDGIVKGERDVLSYIALNKESTFQDKLDGTTIRLNIPLKLQKNIELILDRYKEKLGAEEIIVSIMETETGKIKTLATSNRFDPGFIRQSDIEWLNVNAVEYLFEPGSILKPISVAMAIDKGRVKDKELLYAYNKGKRNSKGEYPRGRYKIGRFYIKDDHQFKKNYLSLEDIVIFSSNIGTLQLAQRLTGQEFVEGLKEFGITEKTGIDLPYEKKGKIPSIRQFSAGESRGKDNVFKATVSYGQGMTGTFMQMLKAYSAFNNNGKIVTPRITSYLPTPEPKQVISKKTANMMKEMLVKTVEKGTGRKTKIDGLEIGGKTGTAQFARRGKYLKKYISSFFGFANDKNRKYTIGVTVIDPISTGKYWYYHYASSSAVPVYKEMVETLVKLNYLKPSE